MKRATIVALIGGCLAIVVCGTVGYLLGSASTPNANDARVARIDAQADAYSKAFDEERKIAIAEGTKQGLERGRHRGQRAGSSAGAKRATKAIEARAIQEEAEAAAQAQREYEESIHIEPDGTECSPGTGLGEPDPQCEPLPGDPDYIPNGGF